MVAVRPTTTAVIQQNNPGAGDPADFSPVSINAENAEDIAGMAGPRLAKYGYGRKCSLTK